MAPNEIVILHQHKQELIRDEIANVNFYAVRQEGTRIHWNNAK